MNVQYCPTSDTEQAECAVLPYRMCSTALQNVQYCPTECAVLPYRMCSTTLQNVQYCPTSDTEQAECAVLPYIRY